MASASPSLGSGFFKGKDKEDPLRKKLFRSPVVERGGNSSGKLKITLGCTEKRLNLIQIFQER